MYQKSFFFFFCFLLSACNKGEEKNYFPHSLGSIWNYKILISSDYTGNTEEKRLTITNTELHKKKDGIKYTKIYSNGNIFIFFKNKQEKNLQRIGARLNFDIGFDEPVNKVIIPSLDFKNKEWVSISQLFIAKGYQPPLRDFKPSAVFEMKYKLISKNLKIKLNKNEFDDCNHIIGKGDADFIADTRTGPIKVKIISEEWICDNVGLVKEKRIESTKASAFGTKEYYKELISFEK